MENFKGEMAELLEVDSVSESDKLQEFESWDSLTSLSIIAFVDEKYHVSLSAKDLTESETIGNLEKLVISKFGIVK
jgi:acyl carrier protein